MDKLKAFKKAEKGAEPPQRTTLKIGAVEAAQQRDNPSGSQSKKRKAETNSSSSDSSAGAAARKKIKGGASSPIDAGKPKADPFDLDNLFASAKAKKEEAKHEAEAAAQKQEKKRMKREQQAAKEEEAVKRIEAAGLKSNRIKGDDSPVPLRVDPDSGLPIYSIDALKIGRGAGNTKDCPIDCNCCF